MRPKSIESILGYWIYSEFNFSKQLSIRLSFLIVIEKSFIQWNGINPFQRSFFSSNSFIRFELYGLQMINHF